MTCSACSAHVQRAVSKLDGVTSAEVNLATETLRVVYDESKVGFEQMKTVVEDAGYGLTVPQMIKRAELGVDGMTCASCSAAVERSIKKLDGVTEASVNLATNRAAFSYDPSKGETDADSRRGDPRGLYPARSCRGRHARCGSGKTRKSAAP